MEPVIQWVGGKKRLLNTLKLFTDKGFNNYHEVFLGGGCLLFNLLPENTISVEKNVNIYKIYENIKLNHLQIIKDLEVLEKNYHDLPDKEARKKYYLDKRDKFNKLNYDTKESGLEKTILLLFMNKTCFNALYRENSKGLFNVPFGNGRDCNICNKEKITKLHEYLNKPDIKIINSDFEYIMDYVKENDIVYIDPPYYPLNKSSFTTYTNDGFTIKDNDRLISFIKKLCDKKVKVILSNSNNQYYKDKLNFLKIYELSISRTLNCKKEDRQKKLCEIIVTNIDISGNYEISNKNNIDLKKGDNLDIEKFGKHLYFTFNNKKIDKLNDKMINVIYNNRDKFEIFIDEVKNSENISIRINAL